MARILLAEDDSSLRHFLAKSLEAAGHEVIAFGDGEDALPVLDAGPFDILISDVVMPNVGGIELAVKAKASLPNLPVIFITGFSAVAVEMSEQGQAGNQVLSKPFHLSTLVEAVDRALDTKAAS
ncbi:response regulator [Sneathiella chinensis]|uniref:Transcriptional regulator n=1 Tax=Sneathiella chinensis TaxID=349750 RepID=A0ABQ5U1N8_9PROT|nr:response regulator [Sneathiella chinensis]GLQ05738.1 transcriptional regulator [Sneathiella chinensis]